MLNKSSKCVIFLFILMLEFSLIFSFSVAWEDYDDYDDYDNYDDYPPENYQYKLGVQKGTTLLYEFTFINRSIVEQLAEVNEFYASFTDTQTGDQIKWVVCDIGETEAFWLIKVNRYRGSDDQFRGSTSCKVFKHPQDLASEMFTNDNINLNFLPVDTEHYIEAFGYKIPEDDWYCYTDASQIIVDFTAIGGYIAYIYEFNPGGQLSGFYIHDRGKLVIAFELVDSWMDYSFIASDMTIAIVITATIACAIYLRDKSKKKSSSPAKKLLKLMENSRN